MKILRISCEIDNGRTYKSRKNLRFHQPFSLNILSTYHLTHLIYCSHSELLSASCCQCLNIPLKLLDLIGSVEYLQDCSACILVPVSLSETTDARTRISDIEARNFVVLPSHEGCVVKFDVEGAPPIISYCQGVLGKQISSVRHSL